MIRFLLICFFLPTILCAQQQVEWASPIDHPIKLAGTFGELRNNHFHTGIDIKSSKGVAGDPIYSVGEGIIQRIRITSGSYGNALYINHPSGHTSVYAHLDSYAPRLQELVEKIQYETQSFEIDAFLAGDSIRVNRRERVGSMGNSGRSYGPHLHFEIRDEKSEIPVNPLNYGYEIGDQLPPKVEYVIANVLDNNLQKQSTKRISLTGVKGNYKAKTDTVFIPAWRVGLGVFVRDVMTGVYNKNGIYSARMTVDGEEVFAFAMDSVSFDEFRYLNAHIDYDHYSTSKHRAHLLYKKPGNKARIYTERRDSISSIIKLYAGKPRKVHIELGDHDGNMSDIHLLLARAKTMEEYEPLAFNYILEQGQTNIINQTNFIANFHAHNFYETTYLSINQVSEVEKNYASNMIHIGSRKTPIHGSYELLLKPSVALDSSNLDKYIIASCEKNKYENFGGKWKDGFMYAKINKLGSYVILLDTIAPTITATTFSTSVKNGSKVSFKIADNMESKSTAKELSYSATVNGKWVLFSYDLKTRSIHAKVDDHWPKGELKFVLEVIDDRGNKSVYRKTVSKL